jgi:hypothetical protein
VYSSLWSRYDLQDVPQGEERVQKAHFLIRPTTTELLSGALELRGLSLLASGIWEPGIWRTRDSTLLSFG